MIHNACASNIFVESNTSCGIRINPYLYPGSQLAKSLLLSRSLLSLTCTGHVRQLDTCAFIPYANITWFFEIAEMTCFALLALLWCSLPNFFIPHCLHTLFSCTIRLPERMHPNHSNVNNLRGLSWQHGCTKHNYRT
jgi:hypothetical protein